MCSWFHLQRLPWPEACITVETHLRSDEGAPDYRPSLLPFSSPQNRDFFFFPIMEIVCNAPRNPPLSGNEFRRVFHTPSAAGRTGQKHQRCRWPVSNADRLPIPLSQRGSSFSGSSNCHGYCTGSGQDEVDSSELLVRNGTVIN